MMQPSIGYRLLTEQSLRGQFQDVFGMRWCSNRKAARTLTMLSFMVNRSNGGSFAGAAIRLSVDERLELVVTCRSGLSARPVRQSLPCRKRAARPTVFSCSCCSLERCSIKPRDAT